MTARPLSAADRVRPGWVNRALKLPVHFWRLAFASWLPPMCRFEPSCSAYALEALNSMPWWRALPKIAGRILRCNPLHPGGYDPVHPCCEPDDEDIHDLRDQTRHRHWHSTGSQVSTTERPETCGK